MIPGPGVVELEGVEIATVTGGVKLGVSVDELEGVGIAAVTGGVKLGVSVDELVLVDIGIPPLVLSEVLAVVMEVKAGTMVELKTIEIMHEVFRYRVIYSPHLSNSLFINCTKSS